MTALSASLRLIGGHAESGGEAKARDAAGAVGAVLEHEGAAVAFGDLAAEDKADAGASGLRGEERDEEVGG